MGVQPVHRRTAFGSAYCTFYLCIFTKSAFSQVGRRSPQERLGNQGEFDSPSAHLLLFIFFH